MRKKITINQEGMAAFHQAMKGAKPLTLKHNKIRLVKPNSKEKIFIQSSDLCNDEVVLNETETGQNPVNSETFISFKHPSISYKTLRKLRKGQYPVEAILDLHGLSIAHAKQAIHRFLSQNLQDKARVVLIIHGKGRHGLLPVLKNKLNQWLRNTPVILAFCSATTLHGSSGAVYLLLKSANEGPCFG